MRTRMVAILLLIGGLLWGQNGMGAELLAIQRPVGSAAREGWTAKDYGIKRSLGLKGHGRCPSRGE